MWVQAIPTLLALSMLGGILCGILWDVTKISKSIFGISDHADVFGKYKKIGNIIFVAFQDILFCIAFGWILCVVTYYGNDGRFRIYAPLCMLFTMLVYRVSIGAAVTRIADVIIAFAKKVIKCVIGISFNTAKKFKKIIKKNRNKEAQSGKYKDCKLRSCRRKNKRAVYKG